MELATHLEERAARLKGEGLGKIKIDLTGCNTSSLVDTLEGAFGSIDQETISPSFHPQNQRNSYGRCSIYSIPLPTVVL